MQVQGWFYCEMTSKSRVKVFLGSCREPVPFSTLEINVPARPQKSSWYRVLFTMLISNSIRLRSQHAFDFACDLPTSVSSFQWTWTWLRVRKHIKSNQNQESSPPIKGQALHSTTFPPLMSRLFRTLLWCSLCYAFRSMYVLQWFLSFTIHFYNRIHCPALLILAPFRPFRQQRDNLQIKSCNKHNFLQNSSDTYWVWFKSKTIIMIATLCLLGRLSSDSWRTCYVTISR